MLITLKNSYVDPCNIVPYLQIIGKKFSLDLMFFQQTHTRTHTQTHTEKKNKRLTRLPFELPSLWRDVSRKSRKSFWKKRVFNKGILFSNHKYCVFIWEILLKLPSAELIFVTIRSTTRARHIKEESVLLFKFAVRNYEEMEDYLWEKPPGWQCRRRLRSR